MLALKHGAPSRLWAGYPTTTCPLELKDAGPETWGSFQTMGRVSHNNMPTGVEGCRP